MTWPAASMVSLASREAFYATVLVAGICIVFLFLLLLVAMRRAGSQRARK